jgi:hypothetical protein
MQGVLLKLIPYSVSEHAEQIHNLTKSLVDFLPLYFHSLVAAQSEPTNSAELVY